MKNENSQENLTILLLGTGGTIAGLQQGASTYRAAQLPIETLMQELAPAGHVTILPEQLAQVDSKDMSFAVWERLYVRINAAQQDPAIDAVVVTHGTDTMEETAYFLHRTLVCTKPVVLTGSMRAADSADADGPRNLSDALKQARHLPPGVWVVFAGEVFSGGNVQKIHPTRLNAFAVMDDDSSTGVDGMPVMPLEASSPLALACIPLRLPVARWPRVEIVMSYAGASGALVQALIEQQVDGLVVAATGNGTVHDALEAALNRARRAGIAVVRSTRCLQGHALHARIDLMLQLIEAKRSS